MSSVQKLIVAGMGPLPWIAAAGLWRALRSRNVEVTVVNTGASCDARVGRWTLPSQRGMHSLLGIAEPQLLQQTGATYKLASEHLGWQSEGSRFLHAHGDIGTDLSGVPFYKYVQSEALAGRTQPTESFALAGAAAALGRFARPMGEGKVLTATFTYAFHFEDTSYARFLRTHALRLGVREAPAALADVLVGERGAITALRLGDESVVSADYFVDCSGPEARLLGRISSSGRDDWTSWLPCDRMWSALAPAVDDAPAVTRTVATGAGWAWRAPLAQSSMVGQVFSTRFQDEAEALSNLRRFEPALQGDPLLTRFSAGRRRNFWEHNCVALGASAVEIEPLAGADPHLAQIGLATFIELFPRDGSSGVEAREYNRLMAEYADALRDFTLAHYRAGAPRPGEFWAAVREPSLPARLADRLDLYAASGRINMLDYESFEETDWAWLLMGCGLRPRSLEQHVRMHLAKLSSQEITALRQHVQQLAASMPRHMNFVRRLSTSVRPTA